MNKQVIFCVDDENIVLQSIKTELFDLFGGEFIIETAESGPEALEILEELLNNHCDIPVIISDYIMPGMKGDELLKKVHRLSPESKKIMLTGQASIEGITNAINHANLFRYLEKPWKKVELKEIIGTALAQYHQNRILAEEHSNLSQTMDELNDKIEGKTMELKELRQKLSTDEIPATAGQLSKNLLLFEEINASLNTIKANMDSLAEQPKLKNSGGEPLSPETEERFYQSNQEEIERITTFINHLKEGRL
jgi:response regulator RpfG family c-di-GMP phosphodiesterase